ncbi:MAG TPA: MFS transporter [Candidatus Sulfotelmatobacter sp.]|nr:MFS transporter [Candidatus Sulfotelmatobacter sp.]
MAGLPEEPGPLPSAGLFGSAPVETKAEETLDRSSWLLRFCVAYAFIMLVFLNYAAVLPLVQREWGLSNSAAGMIFSAYQVGYILSATVLTYLTDRFRARTIFLISASWSVLANVLFAMFAVDESTAIIYRALAGLGMGGTYMPGLKLVADRFPSQERGRAVGYFTSAFVFGAAASTLLTGVIGGLAGWRLAILTTAAGTMVGTLLCLVLLQDDRGVPAADRSRQLRLEVLRQKPALLLIIAYAAHMWEQYGMRAWMAAFLTVAFLNSGHGKGESAAYGGSLTAIIVAAGGFSTWLAGMLSDRLGRTQTSRAIMLVSAAFSLSFGWLLGLPTALLVVVGVAYSFFVVAETPVLSAGLTELVPGHSVGAAMGLQTLVGFLAATASPTVFGWVLDWTNPTVNPPATWGWAFTILGVGALIGPVAVSLARRYPESARMAGGKR